MTATFYTSPTGVRINTAGFTPRAVNRLGRITTNQGLKAGQAYANQYSTTKIPKTAAPAAPTIPQQTFSNIAAPTQAAPAPTDTAGVFPNSQMFEPQNYQGSPLYQFQVKAGLDQVDKSLASRGLTDSGYGIKQELNVPMMAAAQDTQRMQQNADNNANRLQTYQIDQANRQDAASNSQWSRMMDLATLMSGESPWAAAVGGLNSTGQTMDAAGQANANFLQNYYRKVTAKGGGYTPIPTPSGGPDYSNVDLAAMTGNQTSNQGWSNLLNNALMSIFK